MARILVIDDEPGICRALERFFKDRGHEARASSRAETGLTLAEAYEPDVVILDVRLPGMNGLTALGKLRESDPTLPVIVVTAYGTVETAVEAVRRGAWDYILKPLELADVEEVVKRAIEGRRQAQEVVIGRAAPAPSKEEGPPRARELTPMVGRTRAMQEVFKKIGSASLSDLPILFTGESGTGKELAARVVHAASGRGEEAFEAVNCASIPEAQIEAEVFGREGGAGRLARAAGGTVFFDEVVALPAGAQGRLVRHLEGDGGGRGADSSETRPGARVMAATQMDVEAAVGAGSFRDDLFHRLRATHIDLPPLRERAADIPALVAHFLSSPDGPRGAISRAALRTIVAYSWPGNVRELRSAVEHGLAVSRGATILPDHLPDHVRRGARSRPEEDAEVVRDLIRRALDSGMAEGEIYQTIMDRFEEPLVAEVLERTGGNQVQAAKLLGIHRTTLRTKIQKFGL